MAITDHDTIKGAMNIEIDDFVIIVGEEIKMPHQHILALGIDEEIISREINSAIEEIHDKGGIAVIAHPFRYSKPRIERVDAIEVINGRNFPMQNEKAIKYAMERKYPMTAGSDAHFMWEMGRAYTIMDAESSEEAIEKIRKGETMVKSNMNFFHPLKSSFYSFMEYVKRGFKRV